MDFLSYFALAILVFVVLTLAYGMIAIHDIPYHMALKRNHPRRCHSRGWVDQSLYAARDLAVSLDLGHRISPGAWLCRNAPRKNRRSRAGGIQRNLTGGRAGKENCGSRSERIQVQRAATQIVLRLWIYFSF